MEGRGVKARGAEKGGTIVAAHFLSTSGFSTLTA
jgi:hypothetical protein